VTGYSSLGAVADSNTNNGVIRPGKSLKIKLKNYLSMCSNFPPLEEDAKYDFMIYAIRIVFRDNITKEKYVKYLVCSAIKTFPMLYENQEMVRKSGSVSYSPLDSTGRDAYEDFRSYIYINQSKIFGDDLKHYFDN
jgi:hypothetical protein